MNNFKLLSFEDPHIDGTRFSKIFLLSCDLIPIPQISGQNLKLTFTKKLLLKSNWFWYGFLGVFGSVAPVAPAAPVAKLLRVP